MKNETVRSKPTIGWRITRGLISIFLPLQETKWYIRSSRDMTVRNLERMRKAFPELVESEQPHESPDWEEAVAASGKTAGDLEKDYLLQRRIWRIFFWSLALPLPLYILVPLISGNGLSFQQICTSLVLLAGAGIAWSKALIITFRLWQLRTHRVSMVERGTFRHFIAETDAVKGAIRGK